MARIAAFGSMWETHHASLQQANNEPLDPVPPPISRIEDVSARRGLSPELDLDALANARRRIEPAVAATPSDWLPEQELGDGDAPPADEAAEERAIAEAVQADTDRAVAESGIDAIAFYLPITFYGPRHYGIYIRHNRFFAFCATVQKYAPLVPWKDVTAAVLHFLLHHEAYHGAVELSCLASDDFQERKRARTYRTYFDRCAGLWRHAHTGGPAPYRCPEEQLAQHAGVSNMPEDTTGIAIRGALIQVSQTGPADYLYDPTVWSRPGFPKKSQTALERALHRVQSTRLVRCTAPASLNDVDPDVEPMAWFPPKQSRSVLGHDFGVMPVYIIDYGPTVAPRFARACSFGNIALRDFLRTVRRKYGVLHDATGGKHPRLVVGTNKDKVTYPRSAKTTPIYVIDQVADLLRISKEDLIKQCRL